MTTDLISNSRTGAIFSEDRVYRYNLWRIWEPKKLRVMFVGLNPSNADEKENDPTIRRCMNYAESWDYGGILMMNLFAYISTDPKKLYQVQDPVGSDNSCHLLWGWVYSKIVIAAWGSRGSYMAMDAKARRSIPNLRVLKINKDGSPAHPLFLPKNLTPFHWRYDKI